MSLNAMPEERLMYSFDEPGPGNISSKPSPMENNSTDDDVGQSGPLVVPIYQQVILITLYTIVILLSVGGNVVVCYIVIRSRRMRTVINFFIVSLAISDILMALICIPFTFIANVVVNSWPFWNALCPVVSFLQAMAVCLSSFTLVAIGLDRYSAIVHPLRPKTTKRQAYIVIMIIWTLAFVIPLPTAITSNVYKYVDDDKAPAFCMEIWDSIHAQSVYNVFILIVQYFVPLMIQVFTYGRIIMVLWIKKTPGEAVTDRDHRIAKSKKKIIKMMVVVVIIFASCWLPLHVITIAGDIDLSIYSLPGMNIVWTAAHWLAMSNCMYNPFIYCWMNAKYRNGFLRAFQCFTCGLVRENENLELQRMRRQSIINQSSLASGYKTRYSVRTTISCDVDFSVSDTRMHD